MCRWLVYTSRTEDCLLEDVLVTPKHGLAKMVNEHYLPGLMHGRPDGSPDASDADKEVMLRNYALNVDGLGLAWYTPTRSEFLADCTGMRAALYKTVSSPLNDFNFRSLCANTSTKLLFAHIRATSGSAVTPINCHPFLFGRHAFMHNGTVLDFVDIRRELTSLLDRDAFASVQGGSDSEHLAALYISILTKGKGSASWEEEYSCDDMKVALIKAIGTVVRLQKERLGKAVRPNGLNLAISDGRRLLCTRFRNHKTEQPASLYWSSTAGQTLNRKFPGSHDGGENSSATKQAGEHGKHIIVASEPTTFNADEWHLMEKNHYLTVDECGNVSHAAIEYDAAWNVDDSNLPYQSRTNPIGCRTS